MSPDEPPPRRDASAEHARKLDAALAELARSDAPPRRSVLRGLARVGLRLRPAYYYGLLGAWAYYALLLVPLSGLALWVLVWRHDAVRPLSLVTSSLQIGLALGAAAAVLARINARLRRLTPWGSL